MNYKYVSNDYLILKCLIEVYRYSFTNIVREGQFWSIHDSLTRGHPSLILKIIKDINIEHLPITHAPKTRNMKNIMLKENPRKTDSRKSYVLPKIQLSKTKHLTRHIEDMRIRNAIDKSIIRHLKKIHKEKKDGRR